MYSNHGCLLTLWRLVGSINHDWFQDTMVGCDTIASHTELTQVGWQIGFRHEMSLVFCLFQVVLVVVAFIVVLVILFVIVVVFVIVSIGISFSNCSWASTPMGESERSYKG